MDSVAICKTRFNVAINTRLFINYQKGVLLAKNNKLTLNVPAHQFLKTNIPEVFAIRHYYNKPTYDFDLFPKTRAKMQPRIRVMKAKILQVQPLRLLKTCVRECKTKL